MADEFERRFPIRMKSGLQGIALAITTLSGNQHPNSCAGGGLTVLEVSALPGPHVGPDRVTVKVVVSNPADISLVHTSIQ